MSTKSDFLPPLSWICHDKKQDDAQSCLNINELEQNTEIATHENTTVLTIDSPAYLYNLCSERKWDVAIEHLKRSDLSDSLKEQQIIWTDTDGSNGLHKACFNKAPVDIIQSMIEIGGDDIVLKTDNSNVTALHEACVIEVAVEAAKLLIEVGGKELVMKKCTKGKLRTNDYGQSASILSHSTALYVVCENDEIESDIIKDMVSVGRKELVVIQNCNIKTALHHLCYNPSATFDILMNFS